MTVDVTDPEVVSAQAAGSNGDPVDGPSHGSAQLMLWDDAGPIGHRRYRR